MKSVLLSLFFCLLTFAGAPAQGQVPVPPPQRVVSLGPINTENIYLLEAQERLVANTKYCVRPAAAVNKEKIGSVMQVNIEKIISLRPDLILATQFTRADQVKQLTGLGFRVVQFSQSGSFAQSCAQFMRLGKALGLAERAEEIVAQARQEVEAITRRTSAFPKQKVLLQVGSRPLHAAALDSFTHDYITMANGTNIVGDQQDGETNYEKVIAKNPDVIIIAIMGSESGIAAQEKKNWQRFGVITAVREKRVHVIDPNLVCSPSPASFVQALRTIAGLIHPQVSDHHEDKK